MNSIFSYIALGCAIVPFFITAMQFFIFLINRRKYNSLLLIVHNNQFEIPPLYKFYGSIGFLGSFGMSYFFSRLKKGNRIIFQSKEQDAISKSLRKIDPNTTRWLDTYYRLSILSLFLYSIFIIMSLVKIFATQL